MIDTLKIILSPDDIHYEWDIKDVKSKLHINEKYDRKGFKPLGYVKNMSVSGDNRKLIVEGSIAKYYNGNNIENFNWFDIESAVEELSEELELPLKDGRIGRVDIGANIELKQDVRDYFNELGHLEYHLRINRHRTTLRYEFKSMRKNMIFYDKLVETKKKKLIGDFDKKDFTQAKHLMRVEYQFQERVSQIFKKKDLRVSDLYTQAFCKQLMRCWFDTYQCIYKKAVLKYPKKLKGNADFEKFMKRVYVEMFGWEGLNDLMMSAVKQGSLSASDKSKKLKQYREAMLDNYSFEFHENILELNHKVKLMYCEALKQLYKPTVNLVA